MKNKILPYPRIEGKTYTLFGDSDSTGEYYKLIRTLADKILECTPDIRLVIKTIARHSDRKRYLQKILKKHDPGCLISEWLNLMNPYLKVYTQQTAIHLKELPLLKLWDRRLATTREQYHLYMLEIELTNRLNIANFRKADKKISLQPYCLQDFMVDCKASKDGIDYQCRHCSEMCFQNHASLLMKKYHIEPFIWSGLEIKHLKKKITGAKESMGILGIACIPELLHGLRTCRKYNIPAIGIPLNTNRCIRWYGKFFSNSVDLDELEKLISR